jgi:phage host-nuclease inhibitor protein Gam
MAKKKDSIRIIAVALATREDAARVTRETVQQQLDLEAAIVARDAELKTITEKHSAIIDLISGKMAAGMAQLEQWAQTHPHELPGRSTKIDGHQLGWRLGNHATKLLKGWTWIKVVAALEKNRKRIRDTFLRVKTEANKEAMIERRARKKLLASFGVEIIQGETFYLDPNREGQADTQLTGERKAVAA